MRRFAVEASSEDTHTLNVFKAVDKAHAAKPFRCAAGRQVGSILTSFPLLSLTRCRLAALLTHSGSKLLECHSTPRHTTQLNTPHDRSEIIKLPPGALKGLKEGKADDMLAAFHIKTIEQLGAWKHYQAAKVCGRVRVFEGLSWGVWYGGLGVSLTQCFLTTSILLHAAFPPHLPLRLPPPPLLQAISVLAATEQEGKRQPGSASNINGIVDKAFEGKSFKEVLASPPSALQGLAPW